MKVFPVVHIEQPEIAAEQAEVAVTLGADGVYLIDHTIENTDPTMLFETFALVDARLPGAYVGINILGKAPLSACVAVDAALSSGAIGRCPDGLWVDNAFAEHVAGEAIAYKRAHVAIQNMLYLGGIAFKYTTKYTDNPTVASQLVVENKDRVDVVTTSGKGTGCTPSVAKIQAMKRAADGPLAVASGISFENIDDYRGAIDEILVASSVETAPYSGFFDIQKLQAFIEKAHSL